MTDRYIHFPYAGEHLVAFWHPDHAEWLRVVGRFTSIERAESYAETENMVLDTIEADDPWPPADEMTPPAIDPQTNVTPGKLRPRAEPGQPLMPAEPGSVSHETKPPDDPSDEGGDAAPGDESELSENIGQLPMSAPKGEAAAESPESEQREAAAGPVEPPAEAANPQLAQNLKSEPSDGAGVATTPETAIEVPARPKLTGRAQELLDYLWSLHTTGKPLPETPSAAATCVGIPKGSIVYVFGRLEAAGELTRRTRGDRWGVRFENGHELWSEAKEAPEPDLTDPFLIDFRNARCVDHVVTFLEKHGFEIDKTSRGYEVDGLGTLTPRQLVTAANNERARMDPPLPLFQIAGPLA